MKLYDTDAIINSAKPLRETSQDNWGYLEGWKMDSGIFDMKLLRHSDKCPDGFKLHTMHMVEMKAGQSWKDQMKCLCTEATNGLRSARVEDKQGNEREILLPTKPCFICDFVETCRHKRLKDGSSWYDSLEEDYQKIINELSVGMQRAWLFPVFLYAKDVEIGKTDDGKSKTRLQPDPKNLMSCLFKIKPTRDKRDAALYREICRIIRENGDQVFHRDGMWLRYIRADRTQSIEVGRSRKLDAAEDKVFKTFPNIVEFGKGVNTGAFKRPSQFVSWDRAQAALSNSWWGKKLTDRHGFDFDKVVEGFACKVPPGFTELGEVTDEDEVVEGGESDGIDFGYDEDEEAPF